MNEKLLYEQIKDVVNDPQKTNMVMSIFFPESRKYKFTKCTNGHFFKTEDINCRYCCETKSLSTNSRVFFSKFIDLLSEDDSEDVSTQDVVPDFKLDKKKEILDSLAYLKSKQSKTRKDRESIYTLETVLRNFS